MAAGSNRLPPVTEPSYEGWWEFAYRHGADVASMCEAIGLALADLSDRPVDTLPPLLRRTTIEAAKIKRQRARRG